VVIVPGKEQYKPLLDIVKEQGAQTTKQQRKWFAEKAFLTSSQYDTAIHDYFNK
jgi:phosphoribosylaminoimidazolecarboxamide formyltransferase/IMP cyclohydrolase